jgi:chemotaxis protein MotB
MAEQPIIVIKKVIKKGGHAHHGGAWKLAYADFVTAMMAFFLLMWLLTAMNEKTRKGIAEYFQDPYKATMIDKGQVTSIEEMKPTEMDPQAEKVQAMADLKQLENLKKDIQELIDKNQELYEFKDQVKLEITQEGLRIQIIDNKNMPMFKLASSETEPEIRLILKALAPDINKVPNKITINGHTDGRPYPPNRKGYSNWELSTDRANAARHELIAGGLEESKLLRVTGLADSVAYNPKDFLDPMNRRISIIVMNKKSEMAVMNSEGGNVNETATTTEPVTPNQPATDTTNTTEPVTPPATETQPETSPPSPEPSPSTEQPNAVK